MDTDGGEEAITTSLKKLKLGDPTESQEFVRIEVLRAPKVEQDEPEEDDGKTAGGETEETEREGERDR